MNIKSNVVDAVVYMVCFVPLGILIVLMMWWLADNAKVFQPVANEVAAENATTDEIVVNNTANVVTETEVYKMVCTSDGEGYCKEYSVRRINKE